LKEFKNTFQTNNLYLTHDEFGKEKTKRNSMYFTLTPFGIIFNYTKETGIGWACSSKRKIEKCIQFGLEDTEGPSFRRPTSRRKENRKKKLGNLFW
jgi:hypothetical protein